MINPEPEIRRLLDLMPAAQRCLADPQGRQSVDGYAYQHYRCLPSETAS